jgi:hypothetical protein
MRAAGSYISIPYTIGDTLGVSIRSLTRSDDRISRLVDSVCVIILDEMVDGIGHPSFDAKKLLIISRNIISTYHDSTIEDFLCFRDGVINGYFVDYLGYRHQVDNKTYNNLSMAKINEWWNIYFDIKSLSREQKNKKDNDSIKKQSFSNENLEKTMRLFLNEDDAALPINDIMDKRTKKKIEEDIENANKRRQKIDELRNRIYNVKSDLDPTNVVRMSNFKSFLDSNIEYLEDIALIFKERNFDIAHRACLNFFNQ